MTDTAYTTRYLGPYLVHVFENTTEDKGFWAIHVPSSKLEQEDYVVIREKNGKLSCNCKSYQYRYTCRHCAEIKEVLS